MTTLRISVDMSGYRQRRQASVRVLGDGIRRAVSEAIIEGADYARTHHKHQSKTGRLTGPELYARVTATNEKGTEGEIRNDVPYALWVEEPVKPHRIYPKEGHGFIGPLKAGQSRRAANDIGTHRVALRWYIGDQVFFAPYVDNPGHGGFPFMAPAGEYAGERVAYHTESIALVALRRLWAT